VGGSKSSQKIKGTFLNKFSNTKARSIVSYFELSEQGNKKSSLNGIWLLLPFLFNQPWII
jgi:hypothetical protein